MESKKDTNEGAFKLNFSGNEVTQSMIASICGDTNTNVADALNEAITASVSKKIIKNKGIKSTVYSWENSEYRKTALMHDPEVDGSLLSDKCKRLIIKVAGDLAVSKETAVSYFAVMRLIDLGYKL